MAKSNAERLAEAEREYAKALKQFHKGPEAKLLKARKRYGYVYTERSDVRDQ